MKGYTHRQLVARLMDNDITWTSDPLILTDGTQQYTVVGVNLDSILRIEPIERTASEGPPASEARPDAGVG
jgi:hypothetical protein